MRKKDKTVPIHVRLPESDVAVVDQAAGNNPIPVSRSMMLAHIVRDWVKKQLSPKNEKARSESKS